MKYRTHMACSVAAVLALPAIACAQNIGPLISIVALSAGRAHRIGAAWVYKEYLPARVILALAAGFVANHVAFHRTVDRGSESVTVVSMALVLLLTLLMPLRIILCSLLVCWIGSFIQQSTDG